MSLSRLFAILSVIHVSRVEPLAQLRELFVLRAGDDTDGSVWVDSHEVPVADVCAVFPVGRDAFAHLAAENGSLPGCIAIHGAVNQLLGAKATRTYPTAIL